MIEAPEPLSRPKAARHGRHGRSARSPLTRAPLPVQNRHLVLFEVSMARTAEMLSAIWPELEQVKYRMLALPPVVLSEVPSWDIDKPNKTITLYRIPILSGALGHGPRNMFEIRALTEHATIRASSAYIGKDPWDVERRIAGFD